jgi:GH15 family glucan-1,4-alpha-glucosidase
MTYLPITQHGLVGDLHTAALIGADGRIVWMPWPRFDSPSLFAAILDDARGGAWSLAPTGITGARQSYDGETAILLTEFETPAGRAELRDWMSPWEGAAPGHDLCRVLRCTAGQVEVHGHFAPRPDYARTMPALTMRPGGLMFEAHGLQFYLSCDHEWRLAGDGASLRTTLGADEEVRCVLSSGRFISTSQVMPDLEATRRFWRDWIGKCVYDGLWPEAVRRSAITLKLLTYAPSGAIVAAPTTSLPEWIGGPRNWDYRYTWLRDASFTLYAFHQLGYHDEAHAFFRWLAELRRHAGTAPQIMYGVGGETQLDEFALDHLEGYRGSRPVRIGNAAYRQRQLDVYGGIVDAAYAYEQHGELLLPDEWELMRAEIDYVCAHWDEPDQGIWEMRGPPEHHTFSKLMCWVTLDRGIRLAENEGWAYDRPRWEQTRNTIRESILRYGWKAAAGAFTMTYESQALDASLLIMPLVGFLPPDDPRIRATIERIARELGRGALVYRYRTGDHLPGDEGAFLLCSFWLVDALAMIGEVDEAARRFETLLGYTSAHGLLSEEVDPTTGAALGNYPQAFSHIGLINSAVNLTKAQRRSPEPPAPGTGEHGNVKREA